MKIAKNGTRILSVREINSYIGNMISSDYLLGHVCVEGEVSSVSRGPTGHLYVTLKDCTDPEEDPDAVGYTGILHVNIWRNVAEKLNITITQGDILIVTGACSVYDVKGEYNIRAVSVRKQEQRGWHGEAYMELKRRLGKEGIFDPAHKKPIPKYPRAVGVLISVGTNAYLDITSVAKSRNPYVQLVVCDTRVQGENAKELIVRGIRRLDAMGVDTIIIGRGGGSREELEVFDDEAVVRAVYQAHTPIISGTGHEGDTSLADDAADLRVQTPTAAATKAVPLLDDMLQTIDHNVRLMNNRMSGKCALAGTKTDSLTRELNLRIHAKLADKHAALLLYMHKISALSPRVRVQRQKEILEKTADSLTDNMRRLYERYDHNLSVQVTRLHGNSPTAKLMGGFGYITSGGEPVVSSGQVKTGDALAVTLHDGRILAQVTKTIKTEIKE